MSYESRQRYDYKYFYPSDTVQATTGATVENSSSTTMVKLLELTSINSIHPESTFRIKFDLRSDSGIQNVEGRIYINDTAVGTLRACQAWTTYTEDLTTTGWKLGDRIQIYARALGAWNVEVKQLKICGESSLWENTT